MGEEITTQEAAQIGGVSWWWLRKFLEERRIKARKIGGRRGVRLE